MSFLGDFFSLMASATAIFAVKERASLALVFAGGLILAGLCWWGCSTYSRLWNTRYRVAFSHHVCCALAALLTLAVSVIFVALKHAREASALSVEVWELQLRSDAAWAASTFITAYRRVRDLTVEDFSNHPPPPRGASIPTTTHRAQFECAQTYAKAAASHFNTSRPFLSSIIKARSEVPSNVLNSDIKSFFAAGGKSYPATQGISLVGSEVKDGLRTHLPRVVSVLRGSLLGLFFVGQLLPFGLVGWAAYRDLKART